MEKVRKSKPTMISLNDEYKGKAKKLSTAILGRENLSGLVTYLINKECRERLMFLDCNPFLDEDSEDNYPT